MNELRKISSFLANNRRRHFKITMDKDSCFEITYKELDDILKTTKSRELNVVLQHIRMKYNNVNNEIISYLSPKIKSFISHYNQRLNRACFIRNRFEEQNRDWLDDGIIRTVDDNNNNNSPKKRGPKPKEFVELGDRQKKRRSETLENKMTEKHSTEELRYTADRLAKDKEDEKEQEGQQTGNNRAALSLFVDLDFTVSKWDKLRAYVKKHGSNFPEYRHIKDEKKKCYPENVTVTETSASIKLQSLLNHTAQRIIETKSIDELQSLHGKTLVLISKWGMDGSSGHSQYKQNFVDNSATDCNLFTISMVPINLSCDQKEVWQNPSPSSVRYCRPIKFEFAKEKTEYTKQEHNDIQDQIRLLEVSVVKIGDLAFDVRHQLEETMVDGKVCNAVTENSAASRCNICKARPSEMNNIDGVSAKPCNEEVYKFGLSTLHCRIRFMETILKISHRLPVYKAGSTKRRKLTEKEKEKVAEKKKEVQTKLKEKLHITVDAVKTGSGTTNDGNTARTFFSNPEEVAKITGVDQELITRFANILQVITSGNKINCDKFGEYTKKTAELYAEKYPWWYMPASVHKVLIHGSSVIKSFLVPIGQLSEEALEAGNKEFRNIREWHTRKTSRIDTITDVIHHLLFASDPFISQFRIVRNKRHLPLSEEAQELLEN